VAASTHTSNFEEQSHLRKQCSHHNQQITAAVLAAWSQLQLQQPVLKQNSD
jgi:hypothetical protein